MDISVSFLASVVLRCKMFMLWRQGKTILVQVGGRHRQGTSRDTHSVSSDLRDVPR